MVNQEQARLWSTDVGENRIKNMCGLQFLLDGARECAKTNGYKSYANLTRESIMDDLKNIDLSKMPDEIAEKFDEIPEADALLVAHICA